MNSQYKLVSTAKSQFLVSGSSAKILDRLRKAGDDGMSYSQLTLKTKAPINSLYVFAQRLRKAGLVRTRNEDGETRIVLRDAGSIKITDVKRVG